MRVLNVCNVGKKFGGLDALCGASFAIKPNKVNLLIGANGSGKTTLVNVISGLLRADSGKIMFCGLDITQRRPDQIFNLGMARTFQTPRLFANLSVLENMLVSHHHRGESYRLALLYRRWMTQERSLTEKALSILDGLGISHLKDSLAYDLSGGQIKLLELGKILMSDAKLVLLDEPIAGIAPKLAHRIFSKITDICKKHNTTFLVIEHRLDIALQHADYVYVMGDGSIIAQDVPDKIMQNRDVIASYLG